MKAQVSSAALVLVGVAVLAAGAHGADPAAAAAKGSPQIDQMVVFRSGAVVESKPRAKRTTVKIGGRRCGVAAATALAALARSKPGPVGYHDYGDCSSRPADSSGLFVKSIRGEVNRAQDGWVYKVGRKLATAGAADPAGPFGSGRLKPGADVVWFYCRQLSAGSCQRSLELETEFADGRLTVSVRGYDDAGEESKVAGATVHAGARTATTDGSGRATLTLRRGRHDVYASKRGTIRSFAKRVTIK